MLIPLSRGPASKAVAPFLKKKWQTEERHTLTQKWGFSKRKKWQRRVWRRYEASRLSNPTGLAASVGIATKKKVAVNEIRIGL